MRATLPDRYEPIRRIARGGMASVWCALDRTLHRHVAIKLLAEPYAHDELAGRRFTREARAAARLSGHANVVTIYDVGRTLPTDELPLGRPFIVMEYLPGGTVADALRCGELDQALSLEWLRQAAAALDYAHGRGVIHRDVKLSNFLLDRDRVLHVADFGIAQLGTEDTLSSSGQVLGTAAYLAPERALGLPATESSDRYALAVAAFELLVGERPYRAEHFAAQARQHLEDPPPSASARNEALPPAVDAVLARGMAKNPDERFETAGELVDSIERALSPSLSTRSVARGQVGPRSVSVYGSPGRGRVTALLSLAVVLLAVAIAAGATLIPGGSHRRTGARASAVYAQHRASRRATPHAARDRTQTHSTPSPATSTLSSPTNPPSSPTTTPPPTPAPPPTTAAALESQGHQLMAGGEYKNAIPVLRRAAAMAPRSSLTYAYALYDLGRSLRLAGDPRAAVPILWRRLQIPNQTDVVRNELTLALQALGAQASRGGPATGGASGPGGSQGD
jgi:serine/threonine-protein kinase